MQSKVFVSKIVVTPVYLIEKDVSVFSQFHRVRAICSSKVEICLSENMDFVEIGCFFLKDRTGQYLYI